MSSSATRRPCSASRRSSGGSRRPSRPCSSRARAAPARSSSPRRARREDIPALVNHFIRRFSRRFRREIRGIAPEALVALQAYDFPGNVRELENLIERAFAMGAREQITLADLPSLAAGHAAPVTVTSGAIPQLADVEKELILRALAFYKDDKEAAATALGISRRTIYRRLKEYGML